MSDFWKDVIILLAFIYAALMLPILGKSIEKDITRMIEENQNDGNGNSEDIEDLE